ncbi:hypothetical protein DH2020_025132 [Rehmannia glutinosa]|uniref:Formiminotransferase N-terminal subdomain domain-containing protein n=1 Tax=Rehmannia glutinosa TaxID=99300 RepID=A0ABR0W0P8_REHGL
MLKQMLGCCKVYISESRNRVALEAIERAAKLFPEAPIINKFEDVIYNRVGYTLVSEIGPNPTSCSLRGAVFEMVKAAFQAIDLGMHCGSHPRLGVVDHICFHPLAGISLDHVAGTAKSLAADVGSGLQGNYKLSMYISKDNDTSVMLENRSFVNYLTHSLQWLPSYTEQHTMTEGPLTRSEGPPRAVQKKGVVVVGATQWVDNYNVQYSQAIWMQFGKIAKRVSGRGGGLPSVQSMALAHGKSIIEVACNLLDTSKVGGDEIQREVERLAREEGMDVGEGYYTDHSQGKLIESYLKLVDHSAD